jgi:hypothetical protein
VALTDNEAVAAFRSLVAMLRDNGFGWVVTQVEEKIALGKVQTKKLRARDVTEKIDGLWELREPRAITSQKSALFAVAQEYTAHEQINILLESIILAVPMVHKVAQHAFTNLHQFGLENRLDFEPEAEVTDSFSLLKNDVDARSEANAKLLELIDELRRG